MSLLISIVDKVDDVEEPTMPSNRRCRATDDVEEPPNGSAAPTRTYARMHVAMNFIVYVWEGLVHRGRAYKRCPQKPEKQTSNKVVQHRQKKGPTSFKQMVNHHQTCVQKSSNKLSNKLSTIVKQNDLSCGPPQGRESALPHSICTSGKSFHCHVNHTSNVLVCSVM
jgi:hypothetical protein